VPYIDQSGLYALENAVLDLEKRGIQVLLTAVQEQPKDKLISIDIVPDLISETHIFNTIEDAYEYLRTHFKL
jgi:sulfate permease, SulP family